MITRCILVLMLMKLLSSQTDVIFGDFNKEWETLRKIAHSAVRKYAVSEGLTTVVAGVVDEVVRRMKDEDGKEVDIKHYLYLSMYSILSSAAFGKQYPFE